MRYVSSSLYRKMCPYCVLPHHTHLFIRFLFSLVTMIYLHHDILQSLWSELTKQEQEAMNLLRYDESTWDNPMTNPIEMLSYYKLTDQMKQGLSVLSISPPQWDCHVNHYYGHSWDQLLKARVQIYFAMLGWTRDSWDFGNATKPPVEVMTWHELSNREKEIAREICYFNRETWDELPLSTWVVEWRKLDERQKFPVTSSSSLKVVQ